MQKEMLVPGRSLLFDQTIATSLFLPHGYAYVARLDWESARQKKRPKSLSEFSTSFIVPKPPQQVGDQTIFIFHGMQPSRLTVESKAVLQPVLQWGNQEAGGGKFWSVVSWYVKTSNNPLETRIQIAARTRPVKVSTGDLLYPVIRQKKYDGDPLLESSCEFMGIPETFLTVRIPDELLQCIMALETYKVDDQRKMPQCNAISFDSISVMVDGNLRVKPQWELINVAGNDHLDGQINKHNSIEDQFILNLNRKANSSLLTQ